MTNHSEEIDLADETVRQEAAELQQENMHPSTPPTEIKHDDKTE